jgi:glycine C-acetyltransferase
MASSTLVSILKKEIEDIKSAGLYKNERIITSPQSSDIKVKAGNVINFCANNYLGLANHPDIKEASKKGIDTHGYGLSSVRFICGTQDIHKELEETIADFFGTEDAILYAACFDANAGLFETLLTKEDAIISDELNHASIIDGIRLCKAERFRYKHSDMNELEEILKKTQNHRVRMIATDGVFSMDGDIAKLNEITQLAEKYDAVVMVDDSHATGFFGKTGRGSAEYHNVMDKIDIFTSTLGKAMGGASGGFTTTRKEVVEYLRQKSRPYLFSNTVPPAVVNASLKAFELIKQSGDLIQKLNENTQLFRKKMSDLGFTITKSDHPIVPIMLGEAKLASGMADKLLDEGIYVIGFSYPVVPKGKARIRVQISAAHTTEQINKAVDSFAKIGKELGVIS